MSGDFLGSAAARAATFRLMLTRLHATPASRSFGVVHTLDGGFSSDGSKTAFVAGVQRRQDLLRDDVCTTRAAWRDRHAMACRASRDRVDRRRGDAIERRRVSLHRNFGFLL